MSLSRADELEILSDEEEIVSGPGDDYQYASNTQERSAELQLVLPDFQSEFKLSDARPAAYPVVAIPTLDYKHEQLRVRLKNSFDEVINLGKQRRVSYQGNKSAIIPETANALRLAIWERHEPVRYLDLIAQNETSISPFSVAIAVTPPYDFDKDPNIRVLNVIYRNDSLMNHPLINIGHPAYSFKAYCGRVFEFYNLILDSDDPLDIGNLAFGIGVHYILFSSTTSNKDLSSFSIEKSLTALRKNVVWESAESGEINQHLPAYNVDGIEISERIKKKITYYLTHIARIEQMILDIYATQNTDREIDVFPALTENWVRAWEEHYGKFTGITKKERKSRDGLLTISHCKYYSKIINEAINAGVIMSHDLAPEFQNFEKLLTENTPVTSASRPSEQGYFSASAAHSVSQRQPPISPIRSELSQPRLERQPQMVLSSKVLRLPMPPIRRELFQIRAEHQPRMALFPSDILQPPMPPIRSVLPQPRIEHPPQMEPIHRDLRQPLIENKDEAVEQNERCCCY